MSILGYGAASAANNSAHGAILCLMVIVEILDAAAVPICTDRHAQARQNVKFAAIQVSLCLANNQTREETGGQAVQWVHETFAESLVVAIAVDEIKGRALGHIFAVAFV
jgi:hypothetical protein